MSRLIAIEIDDAGLPAPTPELEQERRVAIFDLIEDNSFSLPPRDGVPEGPFRLLLCVREGGWSSTSPPKRRPRWRSSTCPSARSGRW